MKRLAEIARMLILFFLIGLMASCSVTGEHIKEAEAYCKPYGNIESINPLAGVAICNDGHATGLVMP